MQMPGVATLKTWGLVGLSFLVTALAAVVQAERLARAKDKLQAAKQAARTAQKATQAIVNGQREVQDAQSQNDDDLSKRGLD